MSEPVYIDGHEQGRHPMQPERSLIASVIAQALSDCEIGAEKHAVSAYQWIAHRNVAFIAYCAFIGIDADRVRSTVIERFGARCEALQRARLERAKADAEQEHAERERKAALDVSVKWA